ncbi:MAG: 8-amino-7-oxononanoate synthase [Flavobacterium sp.]|nr:8-amino-7-oxononanoate synthase [Flavobacterium sp.]
MKLPESLSYKLQQRAQQHALRALSSPKNGVDFASNDYLGFATNTQLFSNTHQFLVDQGKMQNGATGSRLLTGNHELYAVSEQAIAHFHQAESALLFNSGYDANVGFFSSVPQKGDIILYDELCHASIRDGIRLSHAKAYKFQHNDIEDLDRLLSHYSASTYNLQPTTFYLVTESVFSMDGDSPNLEELVKLAKQHQAYLVVDEAHALGLLGNKGQGLVQQLQLQDKIFARLVTFGKGMGCHGAAILGSTDLQQYLVNYARSFIYTTGLPPHAVASIYQAYQLLSHSPAEVEKLRENIQFFNQEKLQLGLKPLFVYSKSAIQSAIIPGNQKVKSIAQQLQNNGFDVRAILSPTVPEGQERLRFCLHAYNTHNEIKAVLQLLSQLVFE